MSFSDNQLDQLFGQARSEQPVASMEDTKKAFVTATVIAAGGVLATKGLLKLLTLKKWIIMISAVSIITTGTLIVGLNSTPITNSTTNEAIASGLPETTLQTDKITKGNLPEEHVITYHELSDKDELSDIPVLIENVDDTMRREPPQRVIRRVPPQRVVRRVPPNGQNRRVYAQSQEKITPYDFRFDITESTTEEELEVIKDKAIAVGIEMTYKVRYKDEKIKKINLNLKLKNDENGSTSQSISSSMDVEGSFAYTLAWDTSNEGNSSRMYWGETDKFEQENTEGRTERILEESLNIAELSLDALLNGLDSLSIEMADLALIDWTALEDDLRQVEIDLEESVLHLDNEAISEMMKEIGESSEEIAKAIEEELKAMKIEMEQEREEILEEQKQIKEEQKREKREEKEERKEQKKQDND